MAGVRFVLSLGAPVSAAWTVASLDALDLLLTVADTAHEALSLWGPEFAAEEDCYGRMEAAIDALKAMGWRPS
jgi:hypothetical protein